MRRYRISTVALKSIMHVLLELNFLTFAKEMIQDIVLGVEFNFDLNEVYQCEREYSVKKGISDHTVTIKRFAEENR